MEEIDTASQTTVSSSGLSDNDVTIFRDYRDDAFAIEIEKEVKSRGYNVTIPLCAGRTTTANLISRARHSKIVVVLLSNTSKNYLDDLDPIQLESKRNTSTLLLYDSNFKLTFIKPQYRDLIRVQLLTNPAGIAQQILLFLEAHRKEEHQTISLVDLKRDFMDDLLDLLISPSFSTFVTINAQHLQKCFESNFSSFTGLYEGEFISHFERSIRFHLEVNTGMVKLRVSSQENVSSLFNEMDYSNEKVNLRLPSSEETCQTQAWTRESAFLYENELITLTKQLGELDERYSFFLFVGKTAGAFSQDMQNFLNIPWLRVYDFDSNSRNVGLLSHLETKLEERRAISISWRNADNEVVDLSSRATDWFFPLGVADAYDSLFNGNVLEWYNTNKTVLEKQFKQIANFCTGITTPVIMILWYGCDEKESQCLEWCLSLLYTKISCLHSKMKVIICTDIALTPASVLQQIVTKYQLESTTNVISIPSVCRWMAKAKFLHETISGAMELPASDIENSTNKVELSKKDVAWIGKTIDMVPLNYSDTPILHTASDSSTNFLKGGKLAWQDLSAGIGAAIRDSQSLMEVDKILENDILKDRKSLVVKIYHEPGAGGSTMGRQIIWALHREVPCGVVLPTDSFSVNDVKYRVETLQRQTSLPVVLLVDGWTDKQVEEVMKTCLHGIVIIHVQRYSKDKLVSRYYYDSYVCTLPGDVSREEAEKFKNLYTEIVPQKAAELRMLTMKVQKEPVHVFEYGLTTFNFEFSGIRSYVHGYMQLPLRNANVLDIFPWQRVVAQLSLALYFGQSGLPCEVFRRILQVQGRFVTLAHMDCYACQQFIQEEKIIWKIRYYPIAKEILEQILNNSFELDSYKGKDLSDDACTNLHHLVINFIWTLKDAVQDQRPPMILNLLTKMILRRNRRIRDKEGMSNKQEQLSMLLEHIPNSDNRIEVLQTLTRAFPDCYEFYAHLGRVLSILDQFDDAEEALDEALRVLKESRDMIGKKASDALGRIHNMFGHACLKRVNHALKHLKKKKCTEVVAILKGAEKAVHHFAESRKQATHNFSYGYIGEVKARLTISKHVARFFPGSCSQAFKGGWGQEYKLLQNFVEESHVSCAFLLDACHYYTPHDERVKALQDFEACKNDFTFCYGETSFVWDETETISDRRRLIAKLKLCWVKNMWHYVSSVHYISDDKVIHQIIDLHAKNIQQALFNPDQRVKINIDILEWLDAIRHCYVNEDYWLEGGVLPILNKWDSRSEAVHSTYYCYSVTFILAMYSRDVDRCKDYESQAKVLRDKLRNKLRSYTFKPLNQEVLIKCDKLTIRKLMCADQISLSGKGKKYWMEHRMVQLFQVCTGTIVHSSVQHSGLINLDASTSKHQLQVFFVPLEYDLVGKRYAEEKTKVEFFIRFSVERGAEAIAIKKLQKDKCSKCCKKKYIVTLNQSENICLLCVS